jgi:hypothetical protein
VPEHIYLATKRNGTRIKNPKTKQIFMTEDIFGAGVESRQYEGADIRIYNKERLLIELMRNEKSLPFDYYKEIISSYRRMVDLLDFEKIEKYMSLFKRNEYMFNILQREVL